MDADDLVHPEYFSKCIAALNKYENVGFVGSWAREFRGRSGYRVVQNFEFPFALLANQAFPCNVLRTGAYREVGLPTILEDYEQWILIVEHGWASITVPEALFFYRIRHSSRYHGVTSYEARIAYQLIVKSHAPTYRRYGDELFLLLFRNYSPNADAFPGSRAAVLQFLLKLPAAAIKSLLPEKIRYRLRHRFRVERGKNFVSEILRRTLRW